VGGGRISHVIIRPLDVRNTLKTFLLYSLISNVYQNLSIFFYFRLINSQRLGLIEKSELSFAVAREFADVGRFDLSAHHSYYAVFQYFSAVAFGYFGLDSDSIRIEANANRHGTHVEIFNLIFQSIPENNQRDLNNCFQRLKRRRTKADYSDDHVSDAECMNSIELSEWTLNLLKNRYGEYL